VLLSEAGKEHQGNTGTSAKLIHSTAVRLHNVSLKRDFFRCETTRRGWRGRLTGRPTSALPELDERGNADNVGQRLSHPSHVQTHEPPTATYLEYFQVMMLSDLATLLYTVQFRTVKGSAPSTSGCPLYLITRSNSDRRHK
jgi:hypothetical protein